jgi:hypothetical protein
LLGSANGAFAFWALESISDLTTLFTPIKTRAAPIADLPESLALIDLSKFPLGQI